MDKYYILIIPALIMGTFARVHMIKSDYRQYPTYPRGYLSHFTLGFIAAGLGSVALPALIEKEFAAITFHWLPSNSEKYGAWRGKAWII